MSIIKSYFGVGLINQAFSLEAKKMIDNIIKYKHHCHSSVVGVFVCLVAKYLEHAVHVKCACT